MDTWILYGPHMLLGIFTYIYHKFYEIYVW